VKISKLNFIIYALFFALFKIFAIPTVVQQALKVTFIAIILVFLLRRIKKIELFNISFWWATVIIFTSFLGYLRNSINVNNCIDSVLHGMCIYSLYTLIVYCSNNGYMRKFRNCLFEVLIFYCIASLITVIISGGGAGTSVYYFAGNKFRTCYYFIFLLTLVQVKYYVKINKYFWNKIIYLVLTILVLFLTRYVQCSTAIVASAFIAISVFIPQKIREIMKKPSTVIITLGIASVLLLVTNIISENSYISYIVTDILGKDTGLTGRYRIYSYIFRITRNSFLFGYGYGNYVVGTIVGYGNAQNSVIQLIIDYGIIGLISFILLIIFCFKRGAKTADKWGYYVYIYAMLICSMVEICFNYNFYTVMFLIGWDNSEEKSTLEKHR